MATINLAEHVIAILRAHKVERSQAGILCLSPFGSVARGDAEAESNVDLAVAFDPAAEADFIRIVGFERQIGKALGRPVGDLPEMVEDPPGVG